MNSGLILCLKETRVDPFHYYLDLSNNCNYVALINSKIIHILSMFIKICFTINLFDLLVKMMVLYIPYVYTYNIGSQEFFWTKWGRE